MPMYEYQCSKCGLKFEDLKTNMKGSDKSECPDCGSESNRLMSAFAPVVTGGSTNETIDMTVGRRANQRWQNYYDRQAKRHANKELKTFDLPQTKDGKFMPVMGLGDKQTVQSRKDYVKALQQHRKERSEKGQGQFKEAGDF